MNLAAVMPVRNEDWILGFSARVALMWCDTLHLFLHACTDASIDIASAIQDENPGRVVITSSANPSWDEMTQRQEMLLEARRHGATHIAITDADEILTANLIPSIRGMVEGTPRGSILQLPLYNLIGGLHRYHANGVWGRRIVSVAYQDIPALGWYGDMFHAREPRGNGIRLTGFQPVGQGEGGVVHFWGASEERLHQKHRLYRITERLRWPHKDVREIERTYSMAEKGMPWVGDTPEKWIYRGVPAEWYACYERFMAPNLRVDAEPWQADECDRLIAEHGRERFAGLEV